MSDRTIVLNPWCVCLVVALGLLLSLYDMSTSLRQALAQHPGLGVVFLAPLEDDVVPGRYAVLAMTLNPRVRLVAGSLVLVRVGMQELRPLTGTATHFHEPPYAIAGWIETSCLVPGRYELHATMRGAQGEVDTAALPVMVRPVQRLGRAPCRVTYADTDRSFPTRLCNTSPMSALHSDDLCERYLRACHFQPWRSSISVYFRPVEPVFS